MTFEIIYKNDDFVVINKPINIHVHKQINTDGITQLLTQQLQIPKVWLVHRLDHVTSGALILALNKNTAIEFYHIFKCHQITKYYIALSDSKPKKKSGKIIGDMLKARRKAWKLAQSKNNPAITTFSSISCIPNLRLFLLKPQTGKTHQLRVAMKSIAAPIIGDTLYGGTASSRTYLHAYSVEFNLRGHNYKIIADKIEGDLFNLPEVQQQIINLIHL